MKSILLSLALLLPFASPVNAQVATKPEFCFPQSTRHVLVEQIGNKKLCFERKDNDEFTLLLLNNQEQTFALIKSYGNKLYSVSVVDSANKQSTDWWFSPNSENPDADKLNQQYPPDYHLVHRFITDIDILNDRIVGVLKKY